MTTFPDVDNILTEMTVDELNDLISNTTVNNYNKLGYYCNHISDCCYVTDRCTYCLSARIIIH